MVKIKPALENVTPSVIPRTNELADAVVDDYIGLPLKTTDFGERKAQACANTTSRGTGSQSFG